MLLRSHGRSGVGRVLCEKNSLICDTVQLHAHHEGIVAVPWIPCKKKIRLSSIIRIIKLVGFDSRTESDTYVYWNNEYDH